MVIAKAMDGGGGQNEQWFQKVKSSSHKRNNVQHGGWGW